MTERQFRMLMEQLESINEKLTALAISGANQEVVANALVEAMSSQGEETAATDAYFNQRLLRGDDLHAG